MQRVRARNHTIVVNVTVEVDIDDLELTPEDLGGISLEKLWMLEELIDYARHHYDCMYVSARYCSCGLTTVLAQVQEILP